LCFFEILFVGFELGLVESFFEGLFLCRGLRRETVVLPRISE